MKTMPVGKVVTIETPTSVAWFSGVLVRTESGVVDMTPGDDLLNDDLVSYDLAGEDDVTDRDSTCSDFLQGDALSCGCDSSNPKSPFAVLLKVIVAMLAVIKRSRFVSLISGFNRVKL